MQVTITKDMYDGTRSKSVDVDLADGISMTDLMLMLMGADVAGVTITKRFDLQRAISKSEPDKTT